MTGNQFRARADECFRAANSMADPERKLVQLDLAERWLRLAIQLDEMDAKTQHDTPLAGIMHHAGSRPTYGNFLPGKQTIKESLVEAAEVQSRSPK
jgi:hypothetical protein